MKGIAGTSRWNPIVPRLLAGERVLVNGYRRERITAGIGSLALIKGKYRVKTLNERDNGVLVWLERKDQPKEELMDMPVPRKGWDPIKSGKYGPALAELLKGHVIRIEGISSPSAVPGLSREWISDQGFVVRSRNSDGGCVVWIDKR